MLGLLAFLTITLGLLADARSVPRYPGQKADSECRNGPKTRGCWEKGFDVSTDVEEHWPDTGKVVEYSLEITNTTLAPDGFERIVLVVNGQLPGPTIYANWGDTLRIHVKNSLPANGTSMHWHGIRLLNNSAQDGTNGVSECPLAPGQSKTYEFKCTQYGTSWYHSHYSSQYGDGVFGSMVINGPATANYDIDLGPIAVQDWYHVPTTQQTILGRPPSADNGLLNGTMVNATGGGSYLTTTLEKGKKHRLRLINTSVDNYFKVHLDNHPFTVIAADFVPIVPYKTDWLFIGIGQRYDVIIDADQEVSNYWFRAEVQDGCGLNAMNGKISAIFRYKGAKKALPTSATTSYSQSCDDETQLVPYVKKDVPSKPFTKSEQILKVTFETNIVNNENIIQWKVNDSPIKTNWSYPTLQYVLDGNTNYPRELNLIELPKPHEWSYWIMQTVPGTTVNVPHPVHIHGHDFYVLGAGIGNFSDPNVLNFKNPTRRDVAMLPQNGWLVVVFQTENPGAWLMHCHIAWHADEGLAVQFLERASEIASTTPITKEWHQVCKDWKQYYEDPVYYLDSHHSGI